jgi:hypothetical protein
VELLALGDPLPDRQKLPPESAPAGGGWWLGVQFGVPFSILFFNQLINTANMVSSKTDSFKTYS